MPLGSLMEEFLIPGRNFVPGRNWGGNAVDYETFSFYYLFIQHIKTAQQGWFRWESPQYASTSCFTCSDWHHKRGCLVHNRLLLLHIRWCEIFTIIFFVIFLLEKLTVFRFVRGEYEKNFENHWSRIFDKVKKKIYIARDCKPHEIMKNKLLQAAAYNRINAVIKV